MNAPPAQGAVQIGSRRPRYLAQSVRLAEEGSPGLMRSAMLMSAVALVALFTWAGLITVDDELMTAGRMVPAGEPKVIRFDDGGKVAEVLVKDGDAVTEGQILIRFSTDDVTRRLRKTGDERVQVGLLAAGLRALQSGDEPDYSFALPEHAERVGQERLIFTNLKQLTEKRRQMLKTAVRDGELRLRGLESREKKLAKEADLLEEEMLLREDLLKKGLTAKDVYDKARLDVDQAHRKLAQLSDSRQAAAKQLAQARKDASELDSRLEERAVSELALLTEKLDGLEKASKELEQQLRRLDVKAPATGLVRAAASPPPGAAVPPGTVIGEIVPFAGDAFLEVRIPTDKVDRVAAGQAVIARIKAEGFSRYGGITGVLREISSSTFEDELKRPYYKGIVALDRHEIGTGKQARQIQPGMAVAVRVKTGSKTFFQHLFGL